jgi:hypothetical protein
VGAQSPIPGSSRQRAAVSAFADALLELLSSLVGPGGDADVLDPVDHDQILTPREAASFLRISRSSLYRIEASELRWFRVRGRRFYAKSDLRAYVDQRRQAAGDPS